MDVRFNDPVEEKFAAVRAAYAEISATDPYRGVAYSMADIITVDSFYGKQDIYFTYMADAFGTEVAEWIEIDDVNELNKIGKEEGYPLSGNYKLTNNIGPITANDMIGSYAAPFTGTFDGNGYTVSVNISYVNTELTEEVNDDFVDRDITLSDGTPIGTTISKYTNNSKQYCAYVGLFACIKDATVCNVKLTGSINVTTVCGYIGSVVGASYGNSAIINCDSDAALTATLDKAALPTLDDQAYLYPSFVGGIVGVTHNDDSGVSSMPLVAFCENRGSIDCTTGIESNQLAYNDRTYNMESRGAIGGIVGITGYNRKADGTNGASARLFIDECINYGDISALKGEANLGGVVGMTACMLNGAVSMRNCANYGDITRTSSYGDRVAGLIGYLRFGNFENCFNAGTLSDIRNSGKSTYTYLIGFVSVKAVITRCFSVTEVDMFTEAYVPANVEEGTEEKWTATGSDNYAFNTMMENSIVGAATIAIDGKNYDDVQRLRALSDAFSDEARKIFDISGLYNHNEPDLTEYIKFGAAPVGVKACGYCIASSNKNVGGDGETKGIRLLSLVDSLDYYKLGYTVIGTYYDDGGNRVEREWNEETTTVYPYIFAGENDTRYDAVGNYYILAIALDVPVSYGNVEFKITPWYVAEEGGAIEYGDFVTCIFNAAV